MSERLQFHLDEHIDPDIALGLRRYGINISTTVEAYLCSRSDLEQLAFALKEKKVIITHDADFLRLSASGVQHCGIVYCHKTDHSIGEIMEHLILMYEVLNPEEMFGKIEYF